MILIDDYIDLVIQNIRDGIDKFNSENEKVKACYPEHVDLDIPVVDNGGTQIYVDVNPKGITRLQFRISLVNYPHKQEKSKIDMVTCCEKVAFYRKMIEAEPTYFKSDLFLSLNQELLLRVKRCDLCLKW